MMVFDSFPPAWSLESCM